MALIDEPKLKKQRFKVKKKIEIFKIQLSIFTHHREQQAVVYNKSESAMGQFPVTPELLNLMNGNLKGFVYAHHREDGQIEVTGIAPWQEW